MLIHAVGRPELPPFHMPNRFRMEIVYFMTPGNGSDVPELPEKEYWIRLAEAEKWLEELVVRVISPLDARAVAEIELSDEHEAWLEWMIKHQVEHVRIELE